MSRQRWRPERRRILVPAPTAGANWRQVNDSGGLWLVSSLVAVLTTSAVVANRTVALTATSAEDVWLRTSAAGTQAASLARAYAAWPGQPAGGVDVGSGRIGWPVGGVLLRAGDALASVVDLLDAGDQWSAIVLDVTEYPQTLPVHLIPGAYTYIDDDQE